VVWQKKLVKAVKYSAIIVNLVCSVLGVFMTWSVIAISTNSSIFTPAFTGSHPDYVVTVGPISYPAAPFTVNSMVTVRIQNGTIDDLANDTWVSENGYTYIDVYSTPVLILPFSVNNFVVVNISISAIPFAYHNLSAQFYFTGYVSIGPYFNWFGIYATGGFDIPTP